MSRHLRALFDGFDRALRRYAVDVIRKSSEASATERCPLGARLGEAQTTVPSALPRRYRTAAGSESARLPDSNRRPLPCHGGTVSAKVPHHRAFAARSCWRGLG